MKSILKSLFIAFCCFVATTVSAGDATFVMSDIFDGQTLSFDVTSPVSAKVSSNTSKGNAPAGKLGSTNNYFEIILNSDTYNAVKLNGFINSTNTSSGYNWGFQFSTDKGATWSETFSQPNDGNKTVHEIIVNATVPTNANGFRVIRLAGTSTTVSSITLTLDGEGGGSGGGDTPGGDTPGGGDDPTPQPSGDAYAHWRFSGSDAPAIGSSESGTKMTVKFLAKDESKTYSKESAGYNAAVPDDMKSQGSNGIKMGGNVLYLMVTVDGGFKAKDVVSICGYNPWKVSSTEEHSGDIAASVATGTSKTDYNIGTFTLTADANALYMMRAEGSGTGICAIKVTRDGGETPSDPIPVESVTLDVTSVVMDINDTKQLTATVTPSNATDKTVTWTSSDAAVATVSESGLVTAIGQGSATITATSNMDNTKTGTCSVTVNAPAAPIEVESISIKESTTLFIGGSETLTVTYTPADANTGKAITWTSNDETVAKVDVNGKVTGVTAGTAVITATSEKGKTATCAVTVEAVAVTGVTVAPTSVSIKEKATTTLTATVLPDNATNKKITWSSDKTNIATVSANGVVTGVAAGTATITVTTEDGNKTATCTVKVEEASPVPPTALLIHEPEVYEAKEMEGGYSTPLTVVAGREYEVYYTEFTDKTKYPTFSTTLATECKTEGISGSTSETKNVGRPGDTWFEGTVASTSECKNASSQDEFVFQTKMIREHRLASTNTYQFHIKGFDQFSLWGMDKKVSSEVFVVKVDGEVQPIDPSLYNAEKYTIRRYNITTGEHLIEISTTTVGDRYCYMGGFSLRVAQEPRTKYLTGNDSSQVLKPFGAILPVTYATKYNNIPGAETKLEWIGAAADGIELKKVESVSINQLTDTFLLTGNANCPAGEYKYAVVAYLNGIETSRAEGTFSVKNDIKAVTDTSIVAYEGENMDEIKFRYYVFDETKDIIFKWDPAEGIPGVTTTAKNGFFTISGIPTAKNVTYHYLITVEGGDTITGTIKVESSDLGQDPVLYLYQSKTDYIYTYLKECGYNLKERKTKDNLRSAKEYGKYKWILISEDVNANNPEVFMIMRGGVDLPILNMKAFSYAHGIDSLKEAYGGTWGEADNGSISENGKYITVWRDDHPIFKALNKKQGDKIQVLDSIDRKGLMPIKVTQQGGLCLATALKRDREDYYGDGEPETFLHEKPAGLDGCNSKYISLPIAMNSSKYLSKDGKSLLKAAINYLLGNEAGVRSPEVRITEFKLGDIVVYPEIGTYSITLEIDTTAHPELADLSEVVPEIKLASQYTYTNPAIGDTVNMSYAPYIAFKYEVSDYIHREVYEIKVIWRKPQGIEEVYSVGEWVNIYDIFGRKVATTNEDIYTMSLPRGVYIIVTENGQTLKISR